MIKDSRKPFVLIGDIHKRMPTKCSADVIANDDCEGIYSAVKHLIDLGHRNIAYLSRSFGEYSWEKEQLNGYKQALKDSKISFNGELVSEVKKFDITKIKIIESFQ